MRSPATSVPLARRWLLLVVIGLVGPWLSPQAAGASDVSVFPTIGPPGTTVNVAFEGAFSFCAVFFDGRKVEIVIGCDSSTVTFDVRDSASVGDHTILALADGAPTAIPTGADGTAGSGGQRSDSIERTFDFRVTPDDATTTTTTTTITTATTTTTTVPPPITSVPPATVPEPEIPLVVTAVVLTQTPVPTSMSTTPTPTATTTTTATTMPTTTTTGTTTTGTTTTGTTTTVARPRTCPPGQAALTSFVVDPTHGRPGARVSATTAWGSPGLCTGVRDLAIQFDGKPVAGRPPPVGTPGTFEMTVPEDAGPGDRRFLLVDAGDPSVEIGTVSFDVEGASEPEPFPIAWILVALAAAAVLAFALILGRRGRSGVPMEPDQESAGGVPAASDQERWRTALKAASFVGGPQGHDAFALAAGSSNPVLRSTVIYTLARWWRRDRAAVNGVLHSLADRVRESPDGSSARVRKTLSDAAFTIYVAHPEDGELAFEASELCRKVFGGRRRLPRRLWRTPAASLFGSDPDTFFRADDDLRARFDRVVLLVDPSWTVSSETVADDLAALFESPAPPHNALAALAVAVRAVDDFDATEPLVRDLHRRVEAHGRRQLLQAFAVLLPDTPGAWLPLVEQLTRETFPTTDAAGAAFDLALLPLGLAYAKSTTTGGMPVVDALLAESVERADWPLVARVVEALAPIGFYEADLVFRSLRPAMGALLGEPGPRRALASTLATTRTFWFDEVDLFLRETDVGADFWQLVASGTRPEDMAALVARVGLHNTAVHHAIASPTIREHLLQGGFRDLAASSSPRQFAARYTHRVLGLLKASDFQPIRWTDPQNDAGGPS